jgi:threonine aldolase
MSATVDMRSDTVTKPTEKMRKAMYKAIVGDDVYEEDATVQMLESKVAAMFGKQAALFFPSGTMSNLASLLTWCPCRGDEYIVGDKSHIFLFEQASAAQFGSISPRTVANLPNGTMDIAALEGAIREHDIHEPETRLICIENTHNSCGGRVLPLAFFESLRELAKERKGGIPIHLDGARIWNASESYGVKLATYGSYVDSITVCLSKGLGAPAGSLLIGGREFIQEARRVRKALGGGMRQVGILAAAGFQAIADFERGILKKDHLNAQRLASAIREMAIFKLREPIETNIMFLEILVDENAGQVAKMLLDRELKVSIWGSKLLRLVVHRDIDDEHIVKAVDALHDVSRSLNADCLSKLILSRPLLDPYC